VVGEIIESGVRVGAARGRHDVRGDAAEASGLLARGGTRIHGGAPTGQADETHRVGTQPAHETFDTSCALPVLGRRQPTRAGGGVFDQVGHPDSVTDERIDDVAIAFYQPRDTCRRPESVARARVPDAGVGGVEARVQAAHEETHARSDGVGQRAPAVRPHSDRMGFDLYVLDREPGADYDVAQPIDPLSIVIAGIDFKSDRGADAHTPVQVRKAQREVLVDRDGSRFHARIIARR
jgi:hypothetical protein